MKDIAAWDYCQVVQMTVTAPWRSCCRSTNFLSQDQAAPSCASPRLSRAAQGCRKTIQVHSS